MEAAGCPNITPCVWCSSKQNARQGESRYRIPCFGRGRLCMAIELLVWWQAICSFGGPRSIECESRCIAEQNNIEPWIFMSTSARDSDLGACVCFSSIFSAILATAFDIVVAVTIARKALSRCHRSWCRSNHRLLPLAICGTIAFSFTKLARVISTTAGSNWCHCTREASHITASSTFVDSSTASEAL
jgi:hypothetical protein